MNSRVFELAPAERKAMPALIAFWGPSNSGKTLSALKVGRGLVGPTGKLGLVDTENGRAEQYSEQCPNEDGSPWTRLDFQPPFDPDSYVTALRTFEDNGYGLGDCVIVDSTSHVWEGEGGVLDMANNMKKRNGDPLTGIAKWNAPKMAYKRMLNAYLRAPFHVIFCLRAKEGVRQNGGGQNAEIVHTGLEPICEKNFIYEMTVSVLIGPDHKPLFKPIDRFAPNPMIPTVKAPDDLWGAFPPGEYLNEQTGEAIADWVNGGVEFDQLLTELKRVANDIATFGMVRLEEHWKSLSKKDKATLKPFMDEFKDTARRADAENEETAESAESDGTPGDPFDDDFTTGAKDTESEAA